MSVTAAAPVASKLEPHPLAEKIPRMSEEEYRSMRASIQENGQRLPITLFEGKILDGRHRAEACVELGIEPNTVEYEGDSPAAFVVDANLERRNLNASVRAALATEFLPALKEEGRERLARAGRSSAPGRPGETFAQVSKPFRARDEAADLFGVSSATVGRANRVKREAPKDFERVLAGEIAVSTAERNLPKKGGASKKPKPATPTPLNLDSERNRRRAHAVHKRLTKGMSSVDGFVAGLRDEDIQRACLVASAAEVQNWDGIADRAINRLRDLKVALKTTGGADAHDGDS